MAKSDYINIDRIFGSNEKKVLKELRKLNFINDASFQKMVDNIKDIEAGVVISESSIEFLKSVLKFVKSERRVIDSTKEALEKYISSRLNF